MKKITKMIKVVILAIVTLTVSSYADAKYVGDTKAELYYNNNKAVANIAKHYDMKEPLVVYYVKIRSNGRPELSDESKCCMARTLAGGKCIKLTKIKGKLK